MKSALFLALPLLAAARPSSAVEQVACLRLRSEDLAAEAPCGSAIFIAQGLRGLADDATAQDVENAFAGAGCAQAVAADLGRDALARCGELGDLRRREAYAAQGWVPITAPPSLETAAVEIPALKPRASDDETSTSSKRKCSTTRTESTTSCTQKKVGIETCVPTIALFAKCADGMICSKDEANVCMVAKTTLDTGGLIVTIFFAAALTLSIALLTFMCCKERAMHKRLAAKAEAAEIAKEAAAASRKPTAKADTQPLMSGSPGGPRAQSPASPGGYGGDTSSNPFNDGNRL
jgi:hypothetical protein